MDVLAFRQHPFRWTNNCYGLSSRCSYVTSNTTPSTLGARVSMCVAGPSEGGDGAVPGQGSCRLCPAGSFTTFFGSAAQSSGACQLCPPGSYTATSGQSACAQGGPNPQRLAQRCLLPPALSPFTVGVTDAVNGTGDPHCRHAVRQGQVPALCGENDLPELSCRCAALHYCLTGSIVLCTFQDGGQYGCNLSRAVL